MPGLVSAIGAALLAVAGGVSGVVQAAVNADLRHGLGSAAWAGFVSYFVGTICMLLLAAALRESVPAGAVIARSHWWAWSGGFFGAIYIAISIVLVPRLGAAAVVALNIAGQMIGALVLDQNGWLGLAQYPIDLKRLVGAALLIVGAVLMRA